MSILPHGIVKTGMQLKDYLHDQQRVILFSTQRLNSGPKSYLAEKVSQVFPVDCSYIQGPFV